MENPVDNRFSSELTVAVAWYRYARESHAELVQSLDRDRLTFASSASRADVVDDSRVSADRVSVYRMVDRTVSDAGFLHESDDRFESLRVLRCIAVKFNIADVAGITQRMIRAFQADLIIGRNGEPNGNVK